MNNVKFSLASSQKGQPNVWNILIVTAIFAVILVVFPNVLQERMYHPILQSLENRGWVSLIVKPSLLWLSLGMALVAIRTLLWACYRPQPDSDYHDAPRLTVIIPAYNEGAMVQRSIHSCAKANYPRDRIEIIVIDDGSVDDTWEHIERSAQAHPGLVRTVRFEKNRGKREALAAGFRMASGEVVVTVDSDSIIESGTLLALTGPFRDERVGAVAGKVSVLNRYDSLLPRMLHVQYVLSFDFLRSAQSTYGAVCCCPGALSAYRTSLVRKFLEPWVNQQFLGAACNTGEDRALTNNILNLGYKTVYQRTAVVHTLAPETYMRLCRMFLRWDRSYIREEIRLLKIMWKLPVHSLLLTMVDKTITNLRFPVAYITSALLVFLAIHDPYTVVRVLVSIGLTSAFFMLYFLKIERSKEFLYGILFGYFSFFFLFWVFPFALMTVRNRSWMTR
jgi:hyaluronan synthase